MKEKDENANGETERKNNDEETKERGKKELGDASSSDRLVVHSL